MKTTKDINYAQARMARAGLDLSIRDLAEAADLDKATIVRFEAGARTRHTTIQKIREALEEKGATFFVDKSRNCVGTFVPQVMED